MVAIATAVLLIISSFAALQSDHLLLNGRKSFITGGGHASHYLVYCRFGEKPGYKAIGAVIAEKGMEGFSFGNGVSV